MRKQQTRKKRCDHKRGGVTLDVDRKARTVTCLACKQAVDPFDALVECTYTVMAQSNVITALQSYIRAVEKHQKPKAVKARRRRS